MDQNDCELPEPEMLLVAAIYLATRYAKTGCPALCGMIMRQLACLRYHPDLSLPQPVREACGRLICEWGRIGSERTAALQKAAAPFTTDRVH